MDLRNPSHLAELIPHHEHTSLDGLSPVDILKPADDRCLSHRPPKCSVPQAMVVPWSTVPLAVCLPGMSAQSVCALPWEGIRVAATQACLSPSLR